MEAGKGQLSESEWGGGKCGLRMEGRVHTDGWREARAESSNPNTKHDEKAGNYGQLLQAKTMKPIYGKIILNQLNRHFWRVEARAKSSFWTQLRSASMLCPLLLACWAAMARDRKWSEEQVNTLLALARVASRRVDTPGSPKTLEPLHTDVLEGLKKYWKDSLFSNSTWRAKYFSS